MHTHIKSVLVATTLALPGLAQAQFATHTVATEIRFGYQVLITDLNNDGRPDLIGLGAQMPELLWFENPGWERHVIAADMSGMINANAADLDGDGIPEIALAYGFGITGANSTGDIAILRHDGDPTRPWTLQQIDAIPTAHRIRFADIDGNGEPVLVVAPILNEKAESQADPDRLPTPLLVYRPGSWERELVTQENRGVVHGLLPWDLDGDGRDEILTAGRQGIFSHRPGADGSWIRTQLSGGKAGDYPDGGSSDVSAGVFGGEPFFAAIEPFHGNEVVVYRKGAGDAWTRQVIDTELVNGHSLVVADLDGDGNGEIVAGGTRGPKNLYLYRATDADGTRWERSIIDDAIAANGCEAADINGDGRIDISCIDNAAPNDLKWYENTGDW